MDSQQFHRISKALAEPRRYELLSRIAKCRELACSDVRSELPITAATLSRQFAHMKLRRNVWQKYLSQLGKL